MKYLLISLGTLMVFGSCAQVSSSKADLHAGVSTQPTTKEAVATFGEGCFWHAELIFQSLDGVRDAVSGYAGGTDKNPDYEKVSTGETGHAECVQVYYDPSKITYATLVKALFASMDPTQKNGQGNDRGDEYRSIAFYRSMDEKKILEEEIAKINSSGKYKSTVVTQVTPYTTFYPAEDYHQEYALHHPDNSYVRNVSIREYEEFRKTFPGPFKK